MHEFYSYYRGAEWDLLFLSVKTCELWPVGAGPAQPANVTDDINYIVMLDAFVCPSRRRSGARIATCGTRRRRTLTGTRPSCRTWSTRSTARRPPTRRLLLVPATPALFLLCSTGYCCTVSAVQNLLLLHCLCCAVPDRKSVV